MDNKNKSLSELMEEIEQDKHRSKILESIEYNDPTLIDRISESKEVFSGKFTTDDIDNFFKQMGI